MKAIFKDPAVQETFEKKGWVKIPFLTDSEIQELRAFYDDLQTDKMEGFHCSMFHQSYDYKNTISQKLVEVGNKHIGEWLSDYYTLYGNFMVKEPGEASEFKLHQDWAYVDEDHWISLAIWFPLMDLTKANGCLHFVDATHKIENPKRGPGLHFPYEEITPQIMEKYLTPVPMNAGEAVLWDHRVLHYSAANMGEESRISGTMILIPKAAEVIHHYRGGNMPYDEVETYKVDHEFYMTYNIPEGPHYDAVKKENYTFPEVTEAQLLEARGEKIATKEEQNETDTTKTNKGLVGRLLEQISNVFSTS